MDSEPIPVAVRSKAHVCGGWIAEIADWNPAEGTDVPSLVFVVCCVSSGLCGGLIIRSKESYLACGVRAGARACVIVWCVETSTLTRLWFNLGCCATKKLFCNSVL
jgi:hypothetical protein